MVTRNFKSDDVLFREGDQSRTVFRLLSGKAEVTSTVPAGTEVVGTVGPGDFIGEIGVLVACRRSGTARFIEDSTVEEFSRAQFLRLISKDAQLSNRLLHVLSLRTRSQIELLRQLPERFFLRREIRANRFFGSSREKSKLLKKLRARVVALEKWDVENS